MFDSNYEKSFVLNRESLYIICAPYVGEEQVASFETVFYAVRYIFNNSATEEGIICLHRLDNQ